MLEPRADVVGSRANGQRKKRRVPTISRVIERVDGPAAASVAEAVLRDLPDWFGLEEPLRGYVDAARTSPTFIARADEVAVGFVTIKSQTAHAAEILVMGVRREWHRRGVGRALVTAAVEWARSEHARLLQVKTLGPSHPSTDYARTRAFYEALGFIALEESTAPWGEANPCLIMVKPLA
jgi:GNAT superfamily N-acetyltransferase